jgi:uncharacterized repeat protein (TIGR03803 family)
LPILANFNGTDGAHPRAGLIADASGNLFGTTAIGGTNNAGTVFEIAKTADGYANTPTVLVSFNGTDGSFPIAGIVDASGNFFGTMESGGADGLGTVFEIAKTADGYANTPIVLASFNAGDGAYPFGGLIADARGNLFGTTSGGGANGLGTVFEIAKSADGYANTPTVLISFNGTNGADPFGGLIADARGNLFGTASGGGANGFGTVFEVTGSGFVPPLIFAGTPDKVDCVGTSIAALVNRYGSLLTSRQVRRQLC